jgi:cysteine-rich repeat protein
MNEGCDDGNTMSGDGCDSNCMATGCGNSVKNADEECEDGNTTSGDGCDNNCTYTRCGNAVMTAGEGCDDGNTVNGDGCDSNCTLTGCGNGVMTGAETCDDGNITNGDGCDSNCTVTACGNGVTSTGEGCDDGNVTNGDGCDSNCTLTGCGNGVRTTGEVCDDGNAENGDGCDVNCTVSACGNSVVAPTEGCDDGNVVNGDGCDSNCTITACGNGIKTGTEVCDDGNAANGDGCDSNCTVSACGNSAVAPGEECDDGNATELDGCSAACIIEPLEKEPNEDGSPSMGGFETAGNDFGTALADANGAFTRSVVIRGALSPAGDEDVYLFRNTTAQAQTVHLDIWNRALGFGVPCGATMDTALHVRDATGASLVANDDRDGATDFCSSLTFGLRPGESAYAHVSELGDNSLIPGYVLQATYRAAVCGDGTVSPGEMCEDGNSANGDGCSAQCQLEIRPEREPNNTLSDASANPVQITGDTTILGTIKPIADVDTYRLAVATSTVVRFETLTSLYDCATPAIDVRLFDASGAPIISDTAGSGINSCGAIVVFLDAGTYFVGVERRGNSAVVADYLLQVDFQTSRNKESEPPMTTGFNETIMTADRMLAGGDNVYVFGDHQVLDDIDVYSISVPSGARIRAEVVEGDRTAETCESNGIDSRLSLFDQNGVQIADDDDAGRGFCSLIDGSGTVPLDGTARNTSGAPQTYYLMVQQSTLATTAGGTFVYRLQVTFH